MQIKIKETALLMFLANIGLFIYAMFWGGVLAKIIGYLSIKGIIVFVLVFIVLLFFERRESDRDCCDFSILRKEGST